MAQTYQVIDVDRIVRALRRQGPSGLTSRQIAELLGHPIASIRNVLPRNERTAENPSGVFHRIVNPAKPNSSRYYRWTLAEFGG